ncbi:MAG: outer membrane protein assembly factor BamD [Calditrichaeota bacterium]|nr:outer membrane protein assembly factor BamD [Calditrichota bacterium]
MMGYASVKRWSRGILVGLLIWALGCSPKINKQALGPDEYFEYAKKKFDDGDYFEAATEFTVIVLKFSGNPVVDDAQYYLAESHFKMKEYLVAIAEYEKLVQDYPESPYVPLAQFKIGMSYHKLSLRPELDQEYTLKAIRQFQRFIEEYPYHELKSNAEKFIQELRAKLGKKKLMAAEIYRKMGHYPAAIIYYDIVLEEYYDTPAAAEALYWKAECQYQLHQYEEARATFTAFIEKYSQHKRVKKARERIEQITNLIAAREKKEAEGQ